MESCVEHPQRRPVENGRGDEETMSVRKEQAQARAAQVAAIRAVQRRKERRTQMIIIGGVALLIAVLVAAAAFVILGERNRRSALEEAAGAPIEGVVETEGLSQEHVQNLAEPTPGEDGTLLPPMGGDHDPVWQNCGVYSEPVGTANAVHSLEHGAVWITYRPDLTPDQVAELEELVEGESYTLVSPLENLASPIVLTAWGVQLQVEEVSDPRIPVFLEKYVHGEQTPEPGASCSGGVGTPS
jgi:hypothetical protein